MLPTLAAPIRQLLHGIAQVVLQRNAWAGVLVVTGLAVADLRLTAVAIVGLLLGTLTGALALRRSPATRVALSDGLFGFNALLVAVALAVFIPPGPVLLAAIFVGAPLSTLVAHALARHLRLPGLTAPFVLVTWLLIFLVAPPPLPPLTAPPLPLTPTAWPALTLRGLSQIFLFDSPLTGAFILAALLVSSWRAALFALLGAALGPLIGLALGASPAALVSGLWGFSPALTAIALGTTFAPSASLSRRTLGLACAGILFTTAAQVALTTLLAPTGLPVVTAPFVLASWLGWARYQASPPRGGPPPPPLQRPTPREDRSVSSRSMRHTPAIRCSTKS